MNDDRELRQAFQDLLARPSWAGLDQCNPLDLNIRKAYDALKTAVTDHRILLIDQFCQAIRAYLVQRCSNWTESDMERVRLAMTETPALLKAWQDLMEDEAEAAPPAQVVPPKPPEMVAPLKAEPRPEFGPLGSGADFEVVVDGLAQLAEDLGQWGLPRWGIAWDEFNAEAGNLWPGIVTATEWGNPSETRYQYSGRSYKHSAVITNADPASRTAPFKNRPELATKFMGYVRSLL